VLNVFSTTVYVNLSRSRLCMSVKQELRPAHIEEVPTGHLYTMHRHFMVASRWLTTQSPYRCDLPVYSIDSHC